MVLTYMYSVSKIWDTLIDMFANLGDTATPNISLDMTGLQITWKIGNNQ